jgi:hypothetical protein
MTDLLLTGEDALRINSWCSVAGVTLAIEGRILSADDCLVPIGDTHTPNSDRSLHSTILPLNNGRLTQLSARVAAGTVKRGQLWVEVELIRGLASSAQALGVLARGYAAAGNRLAWPGTDMRGSLEGPGCTRAIVGTDPAGGVEIVETVPTGARWRLRTFAFQIVASATVANRTPILTIDDGANVVWESANNTNITASQTAKFRAGIGTGINTNGALDFLVPLPAELVLMAGWRIRTVTGALDAGDNYAAPIYTVEEWIEP